ncbi:MAG: nucleotidyltransferase family protein, partial [Vicinamibacterales bacterium]
MSHTSIARTTTQQEQLLEAILLDAARARAAWRAWSAGADLDCLDAGSKRLLPLLYQRRADLRLEQPLLDRLRAEYIHTWQANQLRLHHLQQAVAALQDAGMSVMLLKGAALLVAHGGDPGLRPMADADLLVPYAMAPRAVDRLSSRGWTPVGVQPHAQQFTHDSGFDLDLHWNVFGHHSGPAIDDPFWQAAERAALFETSVSVLCPADQLLHTCVHGLIWSPTPALRWIADAVQLVNRRPDLDWNRVIEQAERCRLSLFAATALRYLRDRFGAAISDETLRRLDATPIARAERVNFDRQTISSNERPLLQEAAQIWMAY